MYAPGGYHIAVRGDKSPIEQSKGRLMAIVYPDIGGVLRLGRGGGAALGQYDTKRIFPIQSKQSPQFREILKRK
jgi:hypothetical protein